MTREELLERICPENEVYNCVNYECGTSCSRCNELLNEWLDEYDARVRADVIDEILKLPRLNHYDMYDELMYQSIKVNDIERLREPKEDIQETEPDSIILQDFFKGDSQ